MSEPNSLLITDHSLKNHELTKKNLRYVQQLFKDRVEKFDEKQDLLFYQHFWFICRTYLLHAHHGLSVS